MVVIFRMDGIKKGQSNFKVGYSFSLQDNSCFIEFYNKEDVRMDDSPTHLRKRFKELDKNLKEYKFYKSCECCRNYNYSSGPLAFSLSGTIGQIDIALEYFGLVLPVGKEFRVSKLTNNYLTNRSSFTYSKEDNPVWANSDTGFGPRDIIDVDGVIKFTSIEETISRIGKLVIFS